MVWRQKCIRQVIVATYRIISNSHDWRYVSIGHVHGMFSRSRSTVSPSRRWCVSCVCVGQESGFRALSDLMAIQYVEYLGTCLTTSLRRWMACTYVCINVFEHAPTHPNLFVLCYALLYSAMRYYAISSNAQRSAVIPQNQTLAGVQDQDCGAAKKRLYLPTASNPHGDRIKGECRT